MAGNRGSDRTIEGIIKHEESKETRETRRKIDKIKTTTASKNIMKPAITLEGSNKAFNVRMNTKIDDPYHTETV